eukprot:354314-Chlamydomonas_euryale.AAC.24
MHTVTKELRKGLQHRLEKYKKLKKDIVEYTSRQFHSYLVRRQHIGRIQVCRCKHAHKRTRVCCMACTCVLHGATIVSCNGTCSSCLSGCGNYQYARYLPAMIATTA